MEINKILTEELNKYQIQRSFFENVDIVKGDFKSHFYAYHVTQKRLLKSIMKNGLIPSTPLDYGENGDIEGVYLFKTIDDTKNALFNWLGERIEEWEDENDKEYDEIVLEVNLDGLEDHLIDSVEYEWTCTTIIDPSRIIRSFVM